MLTFRKQKAEGRRQGPFYLAPCLLLTAYCLLPTGYHAWAEVTNRIVAIVNDEVITEGDVASHMVALLRQHDLPDPTAEEAGQMRRAVLVRLIEERLIVQEAKRLGLAVAAEEVAERLRAIRQQVGTPEQYQQMLRETQLTEEQLKNKLRDQLLAQNAIDRQVRSRIVISPSELASLNGSQPSASSDPGEEIRADHLLVRVTEQRSPDAARAVINQLHDRLQKGEAFEALAREYSEGPDTQDGGLMGWVHPGELLPELDAVLFQLQPGELSAPIQSRLGFHLVKIVERRSRSADEAADSREQLERQLYQQKFNKALETWLADLKAKAYLQLIDE